MVDRVQPLKLESPDTGGVETDQFPTAIDVQEDYVECAGIAIQDATNRDEKTLIWRVLNDMMFKDGTNPGGCTLTQLLVGGSFDNIIFDWEGHIVFDNAGTIVLKG